MEPIEGQCDSDHDACKIVSAYHNDLAVSNWQDHQHCQYHIRDTWEIVGWVERIDGKWQYKAWGPKDGV